MMINISTQIRELRLYINLPLLKINIILRLNTIQTLLTQKLNHYDLLSLFGLLTLSIMIDSANRQGNLSKWKRHRTSRSRTPVYTFISGSMCECVGECVWLVKEEYFSLAEEKVGIVIQSSKKLLQYLFYCSTW
jgi:hypothetical protein